MINICNLIRILRIGLNPERKYIKHMFIPKQNLNRYKIMSRSSCEKYCTQHHKKTSVIISIKSSWDNIKPELTCTKDNNVKSILYLSFDDIDFEENATMCMQPDDGKKVADFINKWYNKINSIIVHCDGGISRSAGVAAAIMRVKEGDDYPIFKQRHKHPNMTCYLTTLKGFRYI